MIELFQQIERLINERGSAAVLSQRLALASDQYGFLEKQVATLQGERDELKAKCAAMKAEASRLEGECAKLKAQNRQLKQQVSSLEKSLDELHSGNPLGRRCSHCGSPRIKNAGNMPNSDFFEAGVLDEFFDCADCKKQSVFTNFV